MHDPKKGRTHCTTGFYSKSRTHEVNVRHSNKQLTASSDSSVSSTSLLDSHMKRDWFGPSLTSEPHQFAYWANTSSHTVTAEPGWVRMGEDGLQLIIPDLRVSSLCDLSRSWNQRLPHKRRVKPGPHLWCWVHNHATSKKSVHDTTEDNKHRTESSGWSLPCLADTNSYLVGLDTPRLLRPFHFHHLTKIITHRNPAHEFLFPLSNLKQSPHSRDDIVALPLVEK